MKLSLNLKDYWQGVLSGVLSVFISSCSVTAVRPAQEMSNMEVAIRAAKEMGADNLAPDLYRNAIEQGLIARKEFRFKNFAIAKKAANLAREFAEKAEFESIRNGGKREVLPTEPGANASYAPEPISTPEPSDPSLSNSSGQSIGPK
jgi:hypothetical protein